MRSLAPAPIPLSRCVLRFKQAALVNRHALSTALATRVSGAKEEDVKKLSKLGIKKITLRNLDEPTLDKIGGGLSKTCAIDTCDTCVTCEVCHNITKAVE
jgi:hypothetical protein